MATRLTPATGCPVCVNELPCSIVRGVEGLFGRWLAWVRRVWPVRSELGQGLFHRLEPPRHQPPQTPGHLVLARRLGTQQIDDREDQRLCRLGQLAAQLRLRRALREDLAAEPDAFIADEDWGQHAIRRQLSAATGDQLPHVVLVLAAERAVQDGIHGRSLVHNRVDLDENKTDKPRSWDIRPDVLAAVAIWRKHLRKDAETSDRVFADDDGMGLNVDHLATQLRDDLTLRAKVDRTKLFIGSKNRMRLRAHDLRATFVTVSLASGRTWEWCQARTGLGDAMKQRYRRTAATWIAQQQGDLAPMHLTIPELAELITPRLLHGGGSTLAQRLPKPMKVHGKGVEPLRLAAAEPKAGLASEDSRGIEKTSLVDDPSRPEIGGVHPGVGQSWGNPGFPGGGEDGVEAALARALDRASEAGRFDVVAQLARELEARRLGRLPNVAAPDPEGRGRRLP